MFNPNQNFEDPGVPEHLINFLVNYKLDSGLGFQANLQVTGSVQTTQSGLGEHRGDRNQPQQRFRIWDVLSTSK